MPIYCRNNLLISNNGNLDIPIAPNNSALFLADRFSQYTHKAVFCGSSDLGIPTNAGNEYLFYTNNYPNYTANFRYAIVAADSIMNYFNIGTNLPNPLSFNVYVSRVTMNVTTIFAGNSVAQARITDGTNVLMSFGDNDIAVVDTYVAILPMTFTSNGDQCIIQFFESDGTTPTVPTSGAATIIIEYELR